MKSFAYATSCSMLETTALKLASVRREGMSELAKLTQFCKTGEARRQIPLIRPTGKRPEVVQGSGGVTTSPTLLVPVLVWIQKNYLKFLLTVRYSKSS